MAAAVIKPGSKAYRDRMRAQLSALGFAGGRLTEQLAADLVSRCGKRPREAWRLANELSLDEVAVRCNSLAGDPRAPLRKTRIWEYEQWPRGGHRPSVRVLRLLAQVFQTSWDRLIDLEDLERMPDNDREDYHAAATARQRDRVAATPAVGPSGPERPPSPEPGPPTTFGDSPIEEAADESAELATWAAATNIDEDGLARLESEVRAIAHAYVFSPPLPLFLRTRRLRNRVTRLLRGHQRWPHTRELYLIGARACTLLAWMSGDLGNYAAAGDHGWAAWMCAQHADHHGARAWVRATQSKLAFWDGDYVESGRLAHDGLDYAPDDDSVGLLLALLEARAWARLGRTDDATAAVARWHARRERAYRDVIGGLLGVSDAQQHYLAGSTYLWLREPGQAAEETRQALELFDQTPADQRFYGAEMLARIDASRAALEGPGTGDLERAEAHLKPVLAIEPDQRLETFVQNLTHVRARLAGPAYRGSRQAQDLQQRLETYAQEAVSRTLDLRR